MPLLSIMKDIRQNILNEQIKTARAIEALVGSLIDEQNSILEDACANYEKVSENSVDNDDLEPMLEKLDIVKVSFLINLAFRHF